MSQLYQLVRTSALRKDYEGDANKGDFEVGDEALKENVGLYNHIMGDSGVKLVSSTPKAFVAINEYDFTEDFCLSEEELDYYIDGFFDGIQSNAPKILKDLIGEGVVQEDLIESALDDVDIKLSLYRSFKSLYDKWVSNSEITDNLASGYFFNNYGQDDNRTLFDHFKFINRANQDIGGKAVIDVSYLSNLSNTKNGQGPTQTLYQSITNLLSKNNFDFWPLPSNTDLSVNSQSDDDIKDIFRPIDFYIEKPNGPTFNCVFVGGSSRTVSDLGTGEEYSCSTEKTNYNYNSDSFDIAEETDLPEEFKKDNEGIIVFKVKFGYESQNHFSSVELDQTEFRETQESLMVIDALTNPETGSSPNQIGKGNNIFDLYLTRSYNCKVSGLGNMSIQPLMYFKLENVPMFRGTYLIKDVKHTIGAHNIKTEFTGMRQNRVTVPLVTDALSILDLTLSNISLDGETTSLTTNNNVFDSNGQPFIPNKETVDLSTIKGNNSAYVINVKSPGNSGSKKQTPGNKCRKPSKQLEKLPYYTANDTFDIVGTKVPADLFAKEINKIPGLTTIEKRIVYSVARKEQGSPIKCFGNNCFGFNVEGNFSGMDKLVNEGRVLNTFCWVDSVKDRVFPQFSSYQDSVEIFALNQVRDRWINLTFGGYRWWNGGNKPYKQILANAPAELNLYGTAKDGSQINGMKETDSEKVLAAKFVILYYWNWNSNSDKGELVASVKSLENPEQIKKTKGLFNIWNESAKYFS